MALSSVYRQFPLRPLENNLDEYEKENYPKKLGDKQ
jgi:hypothetical protein